jgi:hypothetical protein
MEVFRFDGESLRVAALSKCVRFTNSKITLVIDELLDFVEFHAEHYRFRLQILEGGIRKWNFLLIIYLRQWSKNWCHLSVRL